MPAVRHLSRDENIDCILTLLLPYSPGILTDIGSKLSQVARNEDKPRLPMFPMKTSIRLL